MILISIFCNFKPYVWGLHMPQRADVFITHRSSDYVEKIQSQHLMHTVFSTYLLVLSKVSILEAQGT